MLRQPFSAARPTVLVRGRRADRAMSVLQYGIALLAIGAAVLLGSIR
jgi:hypothetical protein